MSRSDGSDEKGGQRRRREGDRGGLPWARFHAGGGSGAPGAGPPPHVPFGAPSVVGVVDPWPLCLGYVALSSGGAPKASSAKACNLIMKCSAKSPTKKAMPATPKKFRLAELAPTVKMPPRIRT